MLALACSAAHGQSNPLTAEEAIEKQRLTLSAARQSCGRAVDEEEIVVCGERERHRLPLPSEPTPGRRLVGDTASPVALTREETCTNVGPTRGCPSLDILGLGLMIGKAIVEKVLQTDN